MLLIKGYFDELSFIEILKVTSKHEGRLGIWDFANRKQYEFTFQDENLISLNFNARQVSDIDEIQGFMSELVEDKSSYYSFKKEKINKDKETIISTVDLLSFAISSKKEEITDEIYLPNLDTVFETVNKVSFVLDGELEKFWKDSINMLHRGCSGREICDKFGYDEKHTRQCLYKLRTIGLIVPLRAFKPVAPKLREKMMSRNLKAIADSRSSQEINTAPSLSPLKQGGEVSTKADEVNTKPENSSNIPSMQVPSILNSSHQPEIEPPDFIKNSEFLNTQNTQNVKTYISEPKTNMNQSMQEELSVNERPTNNEFYGRSEQDKQFDQVLDNQFDQVLNDKNNLFKRMLDSLLK